MWYKLANTAEETLTLPMWLGTEKRKKLYYFKRGHDPTTTSWSMEFARAHRAIHRSRSSCVSVLFKTQHRSRGSWIIVNSTQWPRYPCNSILKMTLNDNRMHTFVGWPFSCELSHPLRGVMIQCSAIIRILVTIDVQKSFSLQRINFVTTVKRKKSQL